MGKHDSGSFRRKDEVLRFNVEWQEATGRILYAFQDTMEAGRAKMKDAKFRKKVLKKYLEENG